MILALGAMIRVSKENGILLDVLGLLLVLEVDDIIAETYPLFNPSDFEEMMRDKMLLKEQLEIFYWVQDGKVDPFRYAPEEPPKRGCSYSCCKEEIPKRLKKNTGRSIVSYRLMKVVTLRRYTRHKKAPPLV